MCENEVKLSFYRRIENSRFWYHSWFCLFSLQNHENTHTSSFSCPQTRAYFVAASGAQSSSDSDDDDDDSDSDSEDADDEADGELEVDADIVSTIQNPFSSKKRKHSDMAKPTLQTVDDISQKEKELAEKTTNSDSDSSDSDVSSSSSSEEDEADQGKSKRSRLLEDADGPRSRKAVFRDLNTVVNFDFPAVLAGHKARGAYQVVFFVSC